MRTLTRVAIGLVTAATLLAANGPASAGSSAAVPATAPTLTVTGHGWGHGHGMSQYGAQGAAHQGLTYQQILDFYYHPATLASFSGLVRVLITADTDNNTTVRNVAGLQLVDLGNQKTYRLRAATTPRAWRMKTVNGRTRVYFRTAKWHLFRTGGRTALTGAGEFRSANGVLTLRMASGDRRYRGALRFVNSNTVNVLSMEAYLRGVVPSEMPSSWLPAALQAQAVAARTYAAYERAQNASGYYQICDTSHCQVYKGYDNEKASTNAAVTATAGRILTYQGAPAFTQFSSSSGGWTSGGGKPYLTSKQDKYDLPVDPAKKIGDPHYDWSTTILVSKLRGFYGPGLVSIQVTARENPGTAAQWGGRVVTVTFHGGPAQADKSMTGDQFRSMFGLRSTYFDISTTPTP